MITIDSIENMTSCCTLIEHEQISEIRFDKVQDTQRKLKSGQYNLDRNLNIAIDRLLEEILE